MRKGCAALTHHHTGYMSSSEDLRMGIAAGVGNVQHGHQRCHQPSRRLMIERVDDHLSSQWLTPSFVITALQHDTIVLRKPRLPKLATLITIQHLRQMRCVLVSMRRLEWDIFQTRCMFTVCISLFSINQAEHRNACYFAAPRLCT